MGLTIAGGIFSFAEKICLPSWLSWCGFLLLIPIGLWQKYKMDWKKIKLGYNLIFKYKKYKKYKTSTLIDFRNKYRSENF